LDAVALSGLTRPWPFAARQAKPCFAMYGCCLIFRARGSQTTPADHEFVVEASLLLTGNFVLNNPWRRPAHASGYV
jgi:hypothetical protein